MRIQQVRSSRPSWANRWLVLTKLLGEHTSSRFAFSVSRRIGNAVTRNHVKRLLGESIRKQLPEIKGTWDIVLIARQPTSRASLAQIDHAVTNLFRQAHLVREPDRDGVIETRTQ
ncbi:MAG: ribonuclease P protein component [Anaerolineae bacterium]|nr:ribonuclease P protein component [Anaerolineae bacterium]